MTTPRFGPECTLVIRHGMTVALRHKRGKVGVMLSRTQRFVGFGVSAAACWVGGMPGSARAQNTQPLTISAGVDVRHSDNVARSNADQAARRGIRPSDQVISPTLDIGLLKNLGRHQLTVNGTVAYDFYTRNSFLNRERIALSASGIVRASRCSLTLSPSFARRQSDLGEIAIPEAGGRDSVRNVQTTQEYAGTLECGGDIGFRPIAGVEHTIANNSNDIRSFSDNRLTHYTLGIGYARPALGKLQILYGAESADYPNRPRVGGEQDGYSSDQIGGRFERAIGANLQGNAQINYVSLRTRRSGVPDFNGITYSLGLVATLADRLKLGVNLNRETQPALQTDAAYRIARLWNFSATYAFSSLLSFDANAGFTKRAYIGERATFGPPLLNDRSALYSGQINYLFSPRLKLGAELRYRDRRSNDAFYDYNELSEMISIRFVY